MEGITNEAIRERAYYIWQREGCPQGRDYDHWVQAQIELEAETARERKASGNGDRAESRQSRAAAGPKKAAAPKRSGATAARTPRTKKSR